MKKKKKVKVKKPPEAKLSMSLSDFVKKGCEIVESEIEQRKQDKVANKDW